ncbi:MAG: DNA repair protein RecO (recombination protein O) [Alteromonadaceae bacterium]|jgi:DNA repair protein RecO (recombination protein O)
MVEIEQSAFLLHSRPYRENQQIVEFLTENNGKTSAIVYVGKTLKSNKKGLLQPFSPLNIILKGNGSLKLLSRVEASEKSYKLTGNYLYSGFYLNELLVRLLGEHIECSELYLQYKNSLLALLTCQPLELILRHFEMTLLDELGQCFDFSPVFEIDCATFYYVKEQGFIPAVTKMNTPCYDQKHIQAIAQQQFTDKNVLHSYKLLMRQIINHFLDGKPLHSRKLFIK